MSYLCKAWAKKNKTNMHLIMPHRWQSDLPKYAKYNKEILSLNLTLVIIQTRRVKKNRTKSTTMKGKWTNETLEEAMEVVERGMHSLKVLNRAWNIPVTSLSDHLVG
jgi:hypothetical protein